MRKAASAARGWVMVGYDLNDGSLFNYLLDTQNLWAVYNMVPVLALDVYEHAYARDLGATPDGRKPYVEAFFRNLDWDHVNRQLAQAGRRGRAPRRAVPMSRRTRDEHGDLRAYLHRAGRRHRGRWTRRRVARARGATGSARARAEPRPAVATGTRSQTSDADPRPLAIAPARPGSSGLAARLGFRYPSRLAALFDHDITRMDLDSRLDGRFLMPWEHDEPARIGSHACVLLDREVQHPAAIDTDALAYEAVRRLAVAWTLILDPVVYAPCQGLVLRHTALARIIHSGDHSTRARKALAVLIDELACHRLASPRGLRIALGRYDDRALYEDVPRARERLGVAQARFLG